MSFYPRLVLTSVFISVFLSASMLAQGFNDTFLVPPAIYAVQGAPFTALTELTRTETLADETHITHKIIGRVIRDSEGRQRFEEGSDEAYYTPERTVNVRIFDVVARTVIRFNDLKPVATIDSMTPTSAAPVKVPTPKPVAWQADTRPPERREWEKLPSQWIAGLLAAGTRTTYTIPAGREGNDRDIKVVEELWLSPQYRVPLMRVRDDPRHGRMVVRVTGFVGGEPDPGLFRVPQGYEVFDRRPTSETPSAQAAAIFESKRRQANDLYLAGRVLETLPLYEELCRQDQNNAIFAERHAAGLLVKRATLSKKGERKALLQQVMVELRRAQGLGDNSAYVQSILAIQAK